MKFSEFAHGIQLDPIVSLMWILICPEDYTNKIEAVLFAFCTDTSACVSVHISHHALLSFKYRYTYRGGSDPGVICPSDWTASHGHFPRLPFFAPIVTQHRSTDSSQSRKQAISSALWDVAAGGWRALPQTPPSHVHTPLSLVVALACPTRWKSMEFLISGGWGGGEGWAVIMTNKVN